MTKRKTYQEEDDPSATAELWYRLTDTLVYLTLSQGSMAGITIVEAMTISPTAPPDYTNPPVKEVALSVMFERLAITTSQIGALWERGFRSEFPKTEDQPPIELPVERERERHPLQQQAVVQLMSVPTPVRAWFLTPSGTQLIQVQPDRFTHNWRAGGTDEPYPHYESIRARFVSELDSFVHFLQDERLGELKPTQCEVTYVNHIFGEGVWERHGELDRVFRFWAGGRGEFLPPPDDARIVVRYAIPDDSGAFAGRLHISLQPAFRGTGENERQVLLVTLTARGRPLGEGVAGALSFLELGHEWIVRGFTDVTTPAMQRAWGRTR